MAGATSLGGTATEGAKATAATEHAGPAIGEGPQGAQHILGKADGLGNLQRQGRGRTKADTAGVGEADASGGLEAEWSWGRETDPTGSLKADGAGSGKSDRTGDTKVQVAQTAKDRIQPGLLGAAQASEEVAVEQSRLSDAPVDRKKLLIESRAVKIGNSAKSHRCRSSSATSVSCTRLKHR